MEWVSCTSQPTLGMGSRWLRPAFCAWCDASLVFGHGLSLARVPVEAACSLGRLAEKRADYVQFFLEDFILDEDTGRSLQCSVSKAS